ncbi:hydrocephalus-inducing protein homolog [Cimex lectularius]|uniref:Uncharacterized protein n=1 Tax=Cimex lectularius TaxID=79782 RepID=A0A8I6RCK6_CIMLE|nr:hydrocephalus-inducing protein homolog [Cimex lectularius]
MMTNHSPVAIHYRFEVEDGIEPAMLCWDYAHQNVLQFIGKPCFNIDPKEITVKEEQGTLAPNASTEVYVTVLANVSRICVKPLKVFLWDEEYPDMEIKIRYIAEPPKIVFRPKEIHHRFAFIDYPKTFTVSLENQSETSSFFVIIPQQANQDDPLIYHTNVVNGILKPHHCSDVQITVIPTKLGRFEKDVMILIFGLDAPITLCKLCISSIGPCVAVQPCMVHWEPIDLLTDSTKTVTLTNISPIPANWKVEMLTINRKKCAKIPWRTSVTSGVLMPEETMTLDVTAHMVDAGSFRAIMAFEIEYGKTCEVFLFGAGIGSSVLYTPDITKNIHFGSVFRSELFMFSVLVENKGTRRHHLVWAAQVEGGFLRGIRNTLADGPSIRINPFRMALQGGETKSLDVEMYSNTPGYYEVDYVLYAIIGGKGKRMKLSKTRLSVNFIEPIITIDPDRYHFFMTIIPPNQPPNKPLTATFVITSEMVFPNSEVQVSVPRPFYLLGDKKSLKHKMSYYKKGLEDVKFTVVYNAFLPDRHNKVIKRNVIVTIDNKYKTKVPLIGEIMYPNVNLSTFNIDFGICQPCMDNVKLFTICNKTCFAIRFEWKILPETFEWHSDDEQMVTIKRPFRHVAAWHKTPCNFFENLFGSLVRFNDDLPDDDYEDDSYRKRSSRPFSGATLTYLVDIITALINESETNPDAIQLRVHRKVMKMMHFLSYHKGLIANASAPFDPIRVPEHVRKGGIIKAAMKNVPSNKKLSQFSAPKKQPTHQTVVKPVENFKDEEEVDANEQILNVDDHNCFAITEILCPVLAKYINQGIELHNRKIMLQLPYYKKDMAWELDLTPSFGTLPAMTCLPISAFFKPDEFGFAKGKAVIEVKGGPSEYVSLVGACGKVQYEITPHELDFGIRKFCTIWREKITLHNLGSGTFDFEVLMPVGDALTEEMKPRTYTVVPTNGTIVGKSSMDIEITLYPGVCGPIEKFLTFHISCLLPYNLRISGYATMPQVAVLTTKDTSSAEIPIVLCYKGIGALCCEYFDKSLIKKPEKVENDKEENVCLLMPKDPFIPEVFEEDWVFITDKDFVPSTEEISLACERELTHNYNDILPNYIQSHALFHDDNTTNFSFFYVPGYKIDFGGICFGTTVVKTIPLHNQGVLPVSVRLIFPLGVHDLRQTVGLEIKTTREFCIQPGATKKIPMIFSPGTKYQKRVETPFHFHFKMKIQCGVVIPITIKAVLTIPKLTFKKKLNFGIIKCSQKKVIKFVLRNDTASVVEWSCIQRPVKRNPAKSFDPKWFTDFMDSPFEVFPYYGLIQPDSLQLISIDFIPLSEGSYERIFEFYCVHNQGSYQKLRVVGKAVDPLPFVESEVIDFGNTIPFLDVREKFIKAVNNTPYPMEVYFPDYAEPTEEKKVFNALSRYYQVPSLFIPLECFDSSLNSKLTDIYYNKLGVAAVNFFENLKNQPKIQRKMSQHSKTIIRPKSNKDIKKIAKQESEKEILKTFKEASDAPTVDEVINQYLKYLEDHPSIPREDLFYIKKENNKGKGKLILFSGGPRTDYKYYAKLFATQNNYKYMTLDDIILEQATDQITDAAKYVRTAINKVYCLEILRISPYHYGDPEKMDLQKDIHDLQLNLTVKFEAINKKRKEKKMQDAIDKMFLTIYSDNPPLRHHSSIRSIGQRKSQSNRKSMTRKSMARKESKKSIARKSVSRKSVSRKSVSRKSVSRKSVAKKGSVAKKTRGTSGTISKPSWITDTRVFEDLSHEIIKELICPRLCSLMVEQGVVLDFMQNEIIKNPMDILRLIWKCFENSNHDIYAVTLHSSFDKYLREQTIIKIKEEQFVFKRKMDFVNFIEKMDGKEFINNLALDEQQEFFKLAHKRTLEVEEALMIEKETTKRLHSIKAEKKAKYLATGDKQNRRQSSKSISNDEKTAGKDSQSTKRRLSKHPSARRASMSSRGSKLLSRSAKERKAKETSTIDKKIIEKIRKEINDTILEEMYWRYERDAKEMIEFLDKMDPPRKEESEENIINEGEHGDSVSKKVKFLRSKKYTQGIPHYILFSHGAMEQIIIGLSSHEEFLVPSKIQKDLMYDLNPPKPSLYYWLIAEDLRKETRALSFDRYVDKNKVNAGVQYESQPSEQTVTLGSIQDRLHSSIIRTRTYSESSIMNHLGKEHFPIPKIKTTKTVEKPLSAPSSRNISKTSLMKKRKKSHTFLPKWEYDDYEMDKFSGNPFEVYGITCPKPEEAMYPFTLPGARVTLQPGEEATWPVIFTPKGFDSYKLSLVMKVAGWNYSNHVIKIIGNSDIPNIDNSPYTLFREVIEEEPITNSPVYILNKGQFYFGHILPSSTQITNKRLFQVEAIFKIVNISHVDIEEIHFSFYKQPEENFSLDPPTLSIKSRSFAYLTVRAHPLESVGFITQNLIYSIKNNPEPGVIQISMTACKPTLEFIPCQLLKRHEFLYRTATEQLRMKNDSGVPLCWILKNAQQLRMNGIVISKTTGIVGHNGVDDITISVYADKPHVIREDMHFELYHVPKEGERIAEEVIPFELKIEDIIIDISYTKLKDGTEDLDMNYLNFGTVKVNRETTRFFYVYNQGNSDIYLKVSFPVREKQQFFDPSMIFSLKDNLMKVKSGSKLKIEVLACSQIALELNKEHMFSLQVFVLKKGTLNSRSIRDHVASIPIPVSIKVLYSMFVIQPSHELNFGMMEVDAVMNLPIVLENTGPFEFVYALVKEHFVKSDVGLVQKKSSDAFRTKTKGDDVAGEKYKVNKSIVSVMKRLSRMMNKKGKKRGSVDSEKHVVSSTTLKEKSFVDSLKKSQDSIKRSNSQVKKGKKSIIQVYEKSQSVLAGHNKKHQQSVVSRRKGNSAISHKGRKSTAFDSKKRLFKKHSDETTSTRGKKKISMSAIRKSMLGRFAPIFYVSKSSGTVLPGSSVEIIVTCSPQQELVYNENYLLFISESGPEYKAGIPVNFVVAGCVPKVNFNIGKLLQGLDQIEFEDEVDLSSGDRVEVYNKRTNSIMFFNTILGGMSAVSIFINNESAIASCVKFKILDVGKDSCNQAKRCFSLTGNSHKYVVYIPAYSTRTVHLKFKPKCLDKLRIKLEIKTKMQNNSKNVCTRLYAEGRAVLPLIRIIEPKTIEEDELDETVKTILNFGNRIMGLKHTETITFRNVGPVVTTVLVDILKVDKHMSLLPSQNVTQKMDACISENIKFNLRPKEDANLSVQYAPEAAETSEMRILLHVLENPYEPNEIIVRGYGYSNDISINGLDFIIKPEDLEMIFENTDWATHLYNIALGNCNANDLKIISFTLVNLSNIMYLFEWSHLPNSILLFPSCGFILANGQKKIFAVFIPTECITIMEVIQCKFVKIEMESPIVDWSKEKVLVTLLTGGVVTINQLKEYLAAGNVYHEMQPNYRTITEPSGRNSFKIPFLVTGTSDLPEIYISETEIKFDISYLFQKRTAKIYLQNLKEHPAEFSWSIRYKKVDPPADWRTKKGFPFVSIGTLGPNFYPPVTLLKRHEIMEILQKRETCKLELENESSSVEDEDQTVKGNEYEKLLIKDKYESAKGQHDLVAEVESEEQLDKNKKQMLIPICTPKDHHSSNFVMKGATSVRHYLRQKHKHRINRPKNITNSEDQYCKLDKTETSWTTVPSTTELRRVSSLQSWLSTEEIAKITNAFTVTPEEGTVKGFKELECEVTFAPRCIDNFLAKLSLQIKGIDEEQHVFLRGISQMSYCHIEAEQSDYLKRRPQYQNQIQYAEDTSVIEIKTVGTGQTFRKKLNILNPTKIEYYYRWQDEGGCEIIPGKPGSEPKSGEFFVCTTPFGTIKPGMSEEMEFVFKTIKPLLYESLWKLSIPELFLDHNILFVINVSNPNVTFEPSRFELEPSVLGCSTRGETILKNHEDYEMNYHFCQESFYTPDGLQSIDVSPTSGVLPPKSETIISLHFTPKIVRETWFTAKCKIEKMYAPLEFKVKTRCYKTVCSVAQMVNGKSFPLDHTSTNFIDTGRLTQMIPYHIYFKLKNFGILPWYYSWKLPTDVYTLGSLHITCSSMTGLLVQGAEKNVTITVTVKSKSNFSKVPVGLTITKGPEYKIQLSGSSVKPSYEFSFYTHDFGPCIAHEKFDSNFESVILVLKNLDEECLTVERYTNSPVDSAFEFCLTSIQVHGRASANILIKFTPFEIRNYQTTMVLLMNGVYREYITLYGEGTSFEVSVANRRDRIIDFGGVEIGKVVEREVEIINLGLSAVHFNIAGPVSEVFSFRTKVVNFQSITLKPKEKLHVLATFSPKTRGLSYFEKVNAYCQSIVKDLFIVKGVGIGWDIALDREQLPFGLVTIGCNIVKKIALVNNGDLGTSFKWDFSTAGEYFSIHPSEGYSSPGTTLILEVGFFPIKLMKTCRREVQCQLGNGSIVKLTLSGTSIELPSPKGTITFKSNVRKPETKSITVCFNSSYDTIVLKPVVSGLYFNCPEKLEIFPESECKIDVTYHPIFSTKLEQKHSGSLFLSFPDGNVIMYNLIGTTDPPLAEATLNWNCLAKKSFVGCINVKNWLQEPQKMRVIISKKDKDQEVTACKVEGLSHIDLPSAGTREYQIKFFIYKEGQSKWRVTFTNEVTQEYMYFKINLMTKGFDKSKVLEFITDVRKPIFKSVPFANPLDREVLITLKSPIKCLQANPLFLGPNSEGFMQVEFSPLFKMEGDLLKIEFNSPELGKFPFLVLLTANGPLPEPTTYLTGAIGEVIPFVLRPKLMNKMACSFNAYCNDEYIKVPNGTVKKDDTTDSVDIKLCFEPMDVGKFSTQVELVSHDAGRYWYPIVVNCLPPRPLGPFIIKTKHHKTIHFKNPFLKTVEFFCSPSSSKFEIQPECFELEAGQEIELKVEFNDKEVGQGKKKVPLAAKLTIFPDNTHYNHIYWTFYLKGIYTAPQ